MKLEHGTPMDIEGESMRIIREELEAQGIVLPPDRAAVVLRAIHTTADFDYARNLVFTPGAVEAGVRALRAGTPILTDTNMARSGINRGRWSGWASASIASWRTRRWPAGRQRPGPPGRRQR